MTQKATRLPSARDRLLKNKKEIKDLYGLNRQRITTRVIQPPSQGSGSPRGDTAPSGNFLRTEGDTMVGPIAFNPVLVTIVDNPGMDDDDSINISRNTGNNPPDNSSYALVTPTGADDNLRTIFGAAFNGQLLYLQGTATRIIRLQNGDATNDGNIVTPDGSEFAIDGAKIVTLIFDPTISPGPNVQGAWRVLDNRGTAIRDILHAELSVDEAGLVAGNRVGFDQIIDGVQTGITISATAGIFENFEIGRTYILEAGVHSNYTANSGNMQYQWYDINNATFIGNEAGNLAVTSAGGGDRQDQQETAVAIVAPTVAGQQYELRVLAQVNLNLILATQTYAFIREEGGAGTGTGGGGGGITFPILYPIDFISPAPVDPVTTDIDLSATTAHVHEIDTVGDVLINFVNPPAGTLNITGELNINTDAAGSTVSFAQTTQPTSSVVVGANERTIITFQSSDGGATYDIYEAGVGGGGGGDVSQWATFPAVADVDVDLNDINDVIDINFAGAGSALNSLVFANFSGVGSAINSLEAVDFSTASHRIFSSAAGPQPMLIYQVANNESHTFTSGGNILEIEREAGTAKLNMLGNQIDDVGQFIFDLTGTVGIINEPMIHWDASSLDYNVPLNGIHTFQANGVDLMTVSALSVDMQNKRITSVADPTAAQDAATKNYVDTGVFANQQLSNLSGTTNVNLDLFPNQASGGNLGGVSGTNHWFNLYTNRVQFPVTSSTPASARSINSITIPVTGIGYNVPTGQNHVWLVNASEQMRLDANFLALEGVDLDVNNMDVQQIDQATWTGPSGSTAFGRITASASGFDYITDLAGDFHRFFNDNGAGGLVNVIAIQGSANPAVNFLGHDIVQMGDISFNTGATNPIISPTGIGSLFITAVSTGTVNLEKTGQRVLTADDIAGRPTVDIGDSLTGQLRFQDAGGLGSLYNVPTNGIHNFLVGGVTVEAFIDANELNVDDNYIGWRERGSDPAAPPANQARLYCRDNGAGKTQLVVRFNTGAVQVIATEP